MSLQNHFGQVPKTAQSGLLPLPFTAFTGKIEELYHKHRKACPIRGRLLKH
jgi:hypothetical protein